MAEKKLSASVADLLLALKQRYSVLFSEQECLGFRTVETGCTKYNFTIRCKYNLFTYVNTTLQK